MEQDPFQLSDIEETVFDFDNMELTDTITYAVQVGDWLHCTTNAGITFRKHVSPDKILNINSKGEYVLETIRLS